VLLFASFRRCQKATAKASLKGYHVTRPRNPLIAYVCFKAGFIDYWGQGTLKIFEACENAGLPEATIASLDGGILVTLHNNLVAHRRGQVGGQEVETTLDLTDKQKHIESLKKKGVIKREGKTSGLWKINEQP
jgi:ATP-dependent DNA helicase RecG